MAYDELTANLIKENAALREENRRLRGALELVSAFFQKWPGVELLASERQARDKEAYHTLRAIARKAMEEK